MKATRKIFIAIFILALILRFYRLGSVPSGLDWDEVSNSYNAYSILKTTRDEYGTLLPLANRSFDDYKPPLYMYLEVPAVAVFGLTPFAARLPSALAGSALIILVYLLIKRLFNKENLALLAMAFSAISPWLIQFSRVGFEANIGLLMATASFTLFLYSFPFAKQTFSKNKKTLLLMSAVFFGLSFYSYHSERIFVPLLFLATVIIYWKEFIKIPKKFIAGFLILVILIIVPFFIFTPLKAISSRLEETNQAATIKNIDQSILFINEDKNTPISRIIHNRRIIIGLDYLKNYMSHFDVNFLFTKGDNNLRHHIENMGMLYLLELPFLIYGLYLFVKEKTKSTFFILAWLLISPIPAALGDVAPHAIRSFTMVIALETIIAYGCLRIYEQILWKRAYLTILLLVFGTSLFVYLHNYYIHYPRDNASWWQYGYLQAVSKTEAVKNDYNRIIVDPSIEQAYIFWLFGTKYDPKSYQQSGSRDRFANYYFARTQPSNSKDLLVTASGLPAEFDIIDSIKFPNGENDILIGHPK